MLLSRPEIPGPADRAALTMLSLKRKSISTEQLGGYGAEVVASTLSEAVHSDVNGCSHLVQGTVNGGVGVWPAGVGGGKA